MSLCRIVEFSRETLSDFCEATSKAQNRGMRRPDPLLVKGVSKIIDDVQRSGRKAALRYTRKFDAPSLKADQFEVNSEELASAEVSKSQHEAILHSIERVTRFHESQLNALTKGWEKTEVAFERKAWEWRMSPTNAEEDGFEGQRLIPINRVGVYVPGGKACYPSSVIMNVVPAKVAGVQEVMMCTPPRSDGSVSPAVLVVARELGIEMIVKCGGAQAIALMAHGPNGDKDALESLLGWLPVNKIVGPGSKWVNEAKRQLWGMVGLDTFAGPSEVCVLVDETANPVFAAADWLTQVEHAEDNVGYVIATSREVADRVIEEAEKQLAGSPREQTMRKALIENGLVIILKKVHNEPAITASALSAEHLSITVADMAAALYFTTDAGAITLGDYTPQSAGDFCAGPSHTLPTGGAARFSSPVNVMDFLKFQSISQFTKEDLKELLPTIEAFGEMEGFPQHARAARLRFEG